MNEIYLFLPMILFLGLITSYEDLKTGKIRNIWIKLSLVYGLGANLVLLLLMHAAEKGDYSYFVEIGTGALLCLVVGFVLWWAGFWNAGDAKILAVYSLLIPLGTYRYGYTPYFPSFSIIINTFVPFFAVYTAMLAIKTSTRQKLSYIRKSLRPKELAMLLLFLFSATWPMQYFSSWVHSNYFLTVFAMFVALLVFEKVFGNRLMYLLLVTAFFRLLFDRQVLEPASLWLLATTFLGFVVLRFFILNMGYENLTKHVDINLLREGMVPAETIYYEKGNYIRKPLLHLSLVSYLQEKTRKKSRRLFEPRAEGLTKAEVRKLHSLQKELGFEHLRIYETVSFAPYIFLGVLATVIFKGDMFAGIAFLVNN